MSHLVHLAGLFGINENRARVALSRMAAAGEVTTDGSGRYRLAGHLLDRQGRQAGSRRGETRPWDGVVADGGGHRLGPGRPRTGPPGASGWHWPAWPSSARGCGCGPTTSTCGPTRPRIPTWRSTRARPTGIRSRWPPPSGTSTGGPDGPPTWPTRMADLPPTGPDDLAPGFVLSAAVLRHLQADPLLPVGAAAGRVAGHGAPGGVRPLGPAVPPGPADVGPHGLNARSDRCRPVGTAGCIPDGRRQAIGLVAPTAGGP